MRGRDAVRVGHRALARHLRFLCLRRDNIKVRIFIRIFIRAINQVVRGAYYK